MTSRQCPLPQLKEVYQRWTYWKTIKINYVAWKIKLYSYMLYGQGYIEKCGSKHCPHIFCFNKYSSELFILRDIRAICNLKLQLRILWIYGPLNMFVIVSAVIGGTSGEDGDVIGLPLHLQGLIGPMHQITLCAYDVLFLSGCHYK